MQNTTTPASDLNVTPLIDILLVLLTMLILTVPIVTHSVRVDLASGKPTAPRAAVDLDIDFDGHVFWNGTSVADDLQLAAWFRGLAGQTPQPDLRIWPERRSSYERVAQVMAAAQRSGVKHIAIAPIAQ